MLVCYVRKHVLVVGVFGQGIYALFKVEKVPEQKVVMGGARLGHLIDQNY